MEDHHYYEGMRELERIYLEELNYQLTEIEQKAYDEYMQKGVVKCTQDVVSTQKDSNWKDGHSIPGENAIPKYRKRRSRK